MIAAATAANGSASWATSTRASVVRRMPEPGRGDRERRGRGARPGTCRGPRACRSSASTASARRARDQQRAPRTTNHHGASHHRRTPHAGQSRAPATRMKIAIAPAPSAIGRQRPDRATAGWPARPTAAGRATRGSSVAPVESAIARATSTRWTSGPPDRREARARRCSPGPGALALLAAVAAGRRGGRDRRAGTSARSDRPRASSARIASASRAACAYAAPMPCLWPAVSTRRMWTNTSGAWLAHRLARARLPPRRPRLGVRVLRRLARIRGRLGVRRTRASARCSRGSRRPRGCPRSARGCPGARAAARAGGRCETRRRSAAGSGRSTARPRRAATPSGTRPRPSASRRGLHSADHAGSSRAVVVGEPVDQHHARARRRREPGSGARRQRRGLARRPRPTSRSPGSVERRTSGTVPRDRGEGRDGDQRRQRWRASSALARADRAPRRRSGGSAPSGSCHGRSASRSTASRRSTDGSTMPSVTSGMCPNCARM